MNESCPESLCGKTFLCVALCGRPAIQVAVQLCSAMSYLVEVAHIVWDVHSEAVLLDCRQHHPHLTILDIFMEPSETLATNQPAEWNNCLSWLTDDIETEVKRFVFWVCLSGSTVLCFPWLDAIKDIRLPLVLAAGTSLPTTAATRHQCVCCSVRNATS